MFAKASCCFLIISLYFKALNSQVFFSKELINCIVALEKEDSLGNLKYHGTGFRLYNHTNPKDVFIVTCAHVLYNQSIHVKIPLTDSGISYLIKTRSNTINFDNRTWVFDGNNIETKFLLKKGISFVSNDTLDIGIFKLGIPTRIINGKDTVKITNSVSISRSYIKSKAEVELGTSIYFLGFPLEIGTKKGFFGTGGYADEKINPLLRTGIIAWISAQNREFLLDAFSYSGNSGSPVFTQAGVFGEQPYLIGMVLGHLSDIRYDNTKVDLNYGLARCIWIDEILNLLKRL
jgi:hypothetical protein